MNKSYHSVLLIIVAVMVFISFPPSAVWAATINVTETADDDPNIANGFCSLREAIISANTDTAVDSCTAGNNADTILLPAGNFTLSIAGTVEDLSATGDLDIYTAIEIIGVDATTTIIDGGAVDRVFEVDAGPHVVSISNVTIRNGRLTASATVGEEADGGGILNRGITTISNSRIEFNETLSDGGGIYAGSGSNLTLTQCTIRNNTAGSFGGGILNIGTLSIIGSTIELNNGQTRGGGIYNGGDLTLTSGTIRNNFIDNFVIGGGGGGIANSGTMSILTSTIGPNNRITSGWGGGIQNNGTMTITSSIVGPNNSTQLFGGGISNSGQLTLLNSIVEYNNANTAGWGGGIYNSDGELTLTDSTVHSNVAVKNGGGVAISNGMVSINRSTISRNNADRGGGIYIQGGTLNINNSTISRNDWNGVGIYQNDGLSNLNNVTVTQNGSISDIGGGIQVFAGTFNIKNSIVAGNTWGSGTSGPFFDCQGTIISGGYNLIQNTTGCIGMVATDITGQDALLGPLADNDGTTQTHALQTGSPAIDAGNPGGCFDHTGLPITNDQRGTTRPLDGDNDTIPRCDIGAYELSFPADIHVTDSRGQIDDLQIDFGNVPTGTTTIVITVTLTNLGNETLTVSNVQLAGPDAAEFNLDLAVGNNPCGVLAIELGGGQNCTIGVSFTPQSEGGKTANIKITSDDADERIVNVELAGTGYVASSGSGGGGGGGGCTIDSRAPFDPLLPLLLALSGVYLWWRRAAKCV